MVFNCSEKMKLKTLFDYGLIVDDVMLCIWHDDTFDLALFKQHVDYYFNDVYSDALESWLNCDVLYLTYDDDNEHGRAYLKIGIEV